MSVIELKFPVCCICEARATKKVAYVDIDNGGPEIFKHFCAEHAPPDFDDGELNPGDKIIAGLTEAITGKFARVTIAGQSWVPENSFAEDRAFLKMLFELAADNRYSSELIGIRVRNEFAGRQNRVADK
jgi:hypothetical protein